MHSGTITSLDLITAPLPVRESIVDDFATGGWGFGLGPHGYRHMPWWSASGTGSDRKGGRQLPLFWNEIDLRGFRLVARDLDSRNQFAIGFLNLLTAYHVHKGFGWQACLKGQRKTPYPTTTAADPLVTKAQGILDTWRDHSRWPLRSREAFRRWRRDGEVFGRFTFSGWNRLPEFRFVDPELIGSPTGDSEGPDSFGIRTDPDDVLDVLALHVFDSNDPNNGQWLDADRFVWAKANTDSNIKRGVTDFLPLAEQFDGCRRLLRNMLSSTVRQAGTAWVEKMATATLEQARGIVPYVAGRTAPNSANNPIDPWEGYRGYGYDPPEPAGSIKRTEGDREFMPTPAGASASYIDALQASLRGCCVRWGLPEFATSDASNNNFASSLVANSPFVRAVEGTQYEWGATWERPVALKVLQLACEAGYLAPSELARLDVEITEPQVASAEPDKDANTNNTLHQAGVLSATTWQLKLGLDPQHEAENFAKEQPQQQQQPAPPQPGGDLSSLFGESFTGVDANGHHWQDGKQVAKGDAGNKADKNDPSNLRQKGDQHADKRDKSLAKAVKSLANVKDPEVRQLAGEIAKNLKDGFHPSAGTLSKLRDKVRELHIDFHSETGQLHPDLGPAQSALNDAQDQHGKFKSAHDKANKIQQKWAKPSVKAMDAATSQLDRDDKITGPVVSAINDALTTQVPGSDELKSVLKAAVAATAQLRGVPGREDDYNLVRALSLEVNRALQDPVAAKFKAIESRLRESGFTGVDSHGHHWVNGKQVAKGDTDAKPQGTKGVVGLWQSTTGQARNAIETALWNADAIDDSGKLTASAKKGQVDTGKVARSLATGWRDLHDEFTPEERQQVEAALAHVGVKVQGSAGEATKFDGRYHEGPAGLFTGDAVTIARPALVQQLPDGREAILVKAQTTKGN